MNDDYDDTADIEDVQENLPYFRKTFLTLNYVHIFYAFFWVIPWHLNFIFRRFGTLCLFHLHRHVVVKND